MSSGDTLGLFVRLVLSLAVVITLMVVAARTLRNRGVAMPTKSTAPGANVEVLARKGLHRNASIAVVRAGGRDLVVGVTEDRITLLAEADALSLVEPVDDGALVVASTGAKGSQWTRTQGDATHPSPSWKGTLNLLREKTVRKR
jgi:flagellar protein FliO/FliZ